MLFTGEEQGLNGSKAYVKAHEKELEKISGVLVHDSGTGKVLTIGLMANYNARETMDRTLFTLAKGVGLAELRCPPKAAAITSRSITPECRDSGACRKAWITTRRITLKQTRSTASVGTT